MKIIVEEYYQNDLFRYMPEDMFEILDEAYFRKKVRVDVPDFLIQQFNDNREQPEQGS